MEARLVGYQTHVQDIGTQDYVYDGAMAGTSGQAKRMESIRIKLPSTMASEGKIEYKSHIENIGWEKSWKKTGYSGSSDIQRNTGYAEKMYRNIGEYRI